MIPDDIIREVSLDLNDQEPGYEYTHWKKDQLRSYLQEGLNYVYMALKYLFVERVVVKLEPGDVWQQACDCDDIVRVLGTTDATGSRIIRTLRKRRDDDSIFWSGSHDATCRYGRGDRLESYMINATDGRSFKVFPPVSATAKNVTHVLVECNVPPSADSGIVPFEVVAAVKQSMLFRAMMLDSENNAAIAEIGVQHRDTFYRLVQDLRQLRTLEEADAEGNRAARPVQNGSSE